MKASFFHASNSIQQFTIFFNPFSTKLEANSVAKEVLVTTDSSGFIEESALMTEKVLAIKVEV